MSGIKSFLPDRRGWLRAALGGFLISPYLIWFVATPKWTWPDPAVWWPSVRYASVQASISAVGAVFLGFLFFRGLQSCGRGRRAAELALLLPNVVPPLFVGLALLSLVTRLGPFPYGMGAVIVAHILLNSGLAAISLDRMVRARLGAMSETAWVLGAKPWLFIREVAWPQLKGDVACLFLFLFSLSFTSFSIPLLLSGSRAVTLEVAIYDAIRGEGAWDKAVLLAALQSLVLLVLALALPRPFWPAHADRARLDGLSLRGARWLLLLPTLVLLLGWFVGSVRGWSEGIPLEVGQAFPAAVLMTMAIGIAVGVLHLVLFLLTAFVMPHKGLERFLNGYLAPSSAITGFGMLLLPMEGADFAKLVLALSMISFPLLYRWLVHSALTGLRSQTEVARTMGATYSEILLEIIWPQAGSDILRACGLAALWASGDFALSGIILNNESLSIPLLIQTMLSSYRFDGASLLLLPLAAVGLALYALFTRASRYVLH